MSLTSRQIQLARYPTGAIDPGDFRVIEVPVRAPRAGEVLVRNTWTSVDPGLRLRLRQSAPAGYFQAFEPGRPMDGIMTVGEVIESRATGFTCGDSVWHAFGWRDYAVVSAKATALAGLGTLRRLDTTLAPPASYLGPLGGMGLTAYAGMFRVAEVRSGETVWVSAAAGAVGSLAAQFAKLRGARVVGSAGSDDKVRYMIDELGLDAAFNYKSGPLGDLLSKAAPSGLDVYFDNVGGGHLEAALDALRRRGRVALCGAVAGYDRAGPRSSEASGRDTSEASGRDASPGNLFQATANELTLRGFRGSSYVGLLAEMQREVARWLREGALRYSETVVAGLERAPEALARLLAGETIGKTLVRVAA